METVVFLFGVQPIRIGGTEFFTREAALQLAARGWRTVAIFSGPPSDAVREYLALPNLTLEAVPGLEYDS